MADIFRELTEEELDKVNGGTQIQFGNGVLDINTNDWIRDNISGYYYQIVNISLNADGVYEVYGNPYDNDLNARKPNQKIDYANGNFQKVAKPL